MTSGSAGGTIRAILLDIEGTTTPLSFVVDVLFPYARRHLRRQLADHAGDADHAALVERLHDDHKAEQGAGQPVPPWRDATPLERLESVQRFVEWLMDRDRKSPALKALQGQIWEAGYVRGELVGEIYADVRPALERWHAADRVTAIFSSGSVLAQQLLFRHSSAGDLTALIRHYFDTAVGAKSAVDSYHRIAAAIAVPATAIVFVSDVVPELDAARDAGLQTRLSIRPGNPSVPPSHHAVIRSFDELE